MSRTDQMVSTPMGEPMIDANHAAAALQLPYYWFADHTMRARYRIPHYLLGSLVRFRLSELKAWLATTTVHRPDAAAGGGTPGEGAT
ncbi:DNA-binding protein [Ralstonia pseudosolanacearum]|uniref:DNA-binding protein n=1 Tax=Ralstonia pseudosolanacearum TaxID=1310165 RepID=UPI00190FEE1B|nr:DNA-binding protein [Ralstonia pseudosolanacearum]MDO3524875.1 DNA-binding protein [Ralstonia pseudosolanacearum]MDO3549382.1 DNA-binding protein [Ralstonia pseudosolanacearum]MDO3554539.1 DNA-binding protein [Ralstonia pseudosolanacearum]MDO3569250.1 DNA-binding protein [Ralstonia pseudosolanacearum]MDO3584043.1 DNA-binding protein [Ralstonia pseudosolanacearum]